MLQSGYFEEKLNFCALTFNFSKTMLNLKFFCIIKIDFTKIKYMQFDEKKWINEMIRHNFIKRKKKKQTRTLSSHNIQLKQLAVRCIFFYFISFLQAKRENAKRCNKNFNTCLTKNPLLQVIKDKKSKVCGRSSTETKANVFFRVGFIRVLGCLASGIQAGPPLYVFVGNSCLIDEEPLNRFWYQ